MGTLFKYISDEVIANVEQGECPSCGKSGQLFPIDATPNQNEWDVYGDRVEELCAECLRSIPLRKLACRPQERQLQEMINRHFPKGTLIPEMRLGKFIGICDELRRTPQMPLFLQGEDWPFCCGDLTEYVGVPSSYEESIRIGKDFKMWDHGFRPYEELFGDMKLEPESLREVCIFRCQKCGELMFTWQAT
jgi:hypothetical protein